MLSMQRFGAWVAAGSLCVLTACGGGGDGGGNPNNPPGTGTPPSTGNPPSGRTFYTYVTNDLDTQDTISIFSADTNLGELRAAGTVNAGVNPAGVTVVGNRFVYVANNGVVPSDAGNISAYSINSANGSLTPVAGSPFAAGRNPTGVTANPAGTYLYAPNFEGQSISVFRIEASGALTSVGASSTNFPQTNTVRNGVAPAAVAITPNGQYAYSANKSRTNAPTVGPIGSGTVTVFRVESNGSLTAIQNVPAGVDPIALAIDGSGRSLYVANNELPDDPTTVVVEQNRGHVTVFPINSDGTLGTSSSYVAGLLPQAVTVDPAGGTVFVANSGEPAVSLFNRDTNGNLTANGNLGVRNSPWGMNIDPTGRFLFVANAADGADGGISTFYLQPGLAPRQLPFTASAHANGIASTGVLP